MHHDPVLPALSTTSPGDPRHVAHAVAMHWLFNVLQAQDTASQASFMSARDVEDDGGDEDFAHDNDDGLCDDSSLVLFRDPPSSSSYAAISVQPSKGSVLSGVYACSGPLCCIGTCAGALPGCLQGCLQHKHPRVLQDWRPPILQYPPCTAHIINSSCMIRAAMADQPACPAAMLSGCLLAGLLLQVLTSRV